MRLSVVDTLNRKRRAAGELNQRQGQHFYTPGNRFGRSVFVRPMADTVAAGNENHAFRAQPGHEKRIVIRPADHRQAFESKLPASGLDRADYLLAGPGGRIGVEHLDLRQ